MTSPKRGLNDSELVAREYASEERFLVRKRAPVDYVEGTNAEDLAFEAIAEAAPLERLPQSEGPLRALSRHAVFIAEDAR